LSVLGNKTKQVYTLLVALIVLVREEATGGVHANVSIVAGVFIFTSASEVWSFGY
jgi:hypothetical protein